MKPLTTQTAMHIAILVLTVSISAAAGASNPAHPRLLLSAQDANHVRQTLDSSPGFTRSLNAARARVDRYFAEAPDVPRPTDAGGGYTHEQHKRNGIAIHDAGILYLLTGDGNYASAAKRLLFAYAELYPTLDMHPMKKEQSPGRLFWQSLNEAVWLVYAIQGYDAIIETLSTTERARIEGKLLRPLADFLSVESPGTFNRVHNHGTWAVAAVGMTGYVIGNTDYVDMALYGLERNGEAGFIRQLDLLFSPDGYYTEGPYYQRYALMPFVLFARSIQSNDPEIKIFEYRDAILLKAIYTCIQLSYANLFFPINDAIKDKGLDTIELRYGIAIAYALTGDVSLLSIAGTQSSFALTGDGFRLARSLDAGLGKPFHFETRLFRDGPAGKEGGLAVLRNGSLPGHQALVVKATAQGLGHGHFDKLHWLFFDNGREIITDYGAARFLNVEQKDGGRYLPENTSWAKQTVAHNTLVVDEHSHFDGKLSEASRRHPTDLYLDSRENIQIFRGNMTEAYDGVEFSRTMALINGISEDMPVVLDVLRVTGNTAHQFDLPLHFSGHVIATSHTLQNHTRELRPLGRTNGYEHLWLRARADLKAGENFSLTFLNNGRFYTCTVLATADTQVLFTELGANDPNFNLRNEPALIVRIPDAKTGAFVSVLEPHGEYNGSEEFTTRSRGNIASLKRYGEKNVELIHIATDNGKERLLTLSHNDRADVGNTHSVSYGRHSLTWSGHYGIFDGTGQSL